MTTLYPTDTDAWQDPQDTDALSTSPDGRDHQQHHADLNAVALAMEQQLVGPTFTSSGAYDDVVASIIVAAESLSDADGAWGSAGTHSSDTPSLDAAIFTQGTTSVTCDLTFPSGAGTNGKLYFDFITPLSVGSHSALTIDCRFHNGSTTAQRGFRVAASSAAAAVAEPPAS